MAHSENPAAVQTEFAAAQDLDLLHWVQILWDNRWWIAGVTVAVLTVVALYTFLATPIYSATATVYVQTYSRQPMSGFNPTGASSWMEEQKFYNSQQQIMTSSIVMQDVVDKLKLQSHEAFQGSKDPAAILRGMTKVDNLRDSALFRITVMAPYKDDVAIWANAIAEAYQDRMLKDALDFIAKANQVMLAEAQEDAGPVRPPADHHDHLAWPRRAPISRRTRRRSWTPRSPPSASASPRWASRRARWRPSSASSNRGARTAAIP